MDPKVFLCRVVRWRRQADGVLEVWLAALDDSGDAFRLAMTDDTRRHVRDSLLDAMPRFADHDTISIEMPTSCGLKVSLRFDRHNASLLVEALEGGGV
jgi:hypothetical protein